MEIFNLPDVPFKKEGDGKYFQWLNEDQPLPWETDRFQGANGKRWRHTLYFYCIRQESVVALIRQLAPFPTKGEDEPLTGHTCLAAIVLDEDGRTTDRTYVRASFAYGLKVLLEGGSLEEVPELLRKAHADYLLRFQIEPDRQEEAGIEEDEDADPEDMYEEDDETYADDDTYDAEEEDLPDAEESERSMEGVSLSVGWNELKKELDDLEQLAGDLLPGEYDILCVSEMIYEKAPLDAPFLNSFYTGDLNYLIGHPGDMGNPLSIYLTDRIHEDQRHDLLDRGVMFYYIDPRHQTPGRWPSPPAYGLHSAQQAALHIAIPSLKGTSGLWGINGPPGTGKTTLLREIVADVVVERAIRLLDMDVTKLFNRSWNRLGERMGYYAPNGNLFNDGILVASNNNAAVENISKELPLLKHIDVETFNKSQPQYFRAAAQALGGKEPCWGLLSAVLGNSRNRQSFKDKFWFTEGIGLKDHLKPYCDDPGLREKCLHQYEAAAERLQEQLGDYRHFQDQATRYHALLADRLRGKGRTRKKTRAFEELADILLNEYEIAPENLPGDDFFTLSMSDIHKMTPYSSPKVSTLRSDIFLTSLKMHECAVYINAKQFKANLGAFVNMLSGDQGSLIDEKVTPILWNTFFFMVPVVSTTLASMERLFPKSGRGSLGWLLLDEAGQATPQSACGAIWRSQRCIIIGDTLQVPPIVTMPLGLERTLRERYGLEDICWEPSGHSVQFLADRITPIGTYVEIEGSHIWTGIPLRAHRRCNDPMFSIANTIAYNGQMVKVTQDAKMDIHFDTCWIDVRGRTVANGNAVKEEVDVLKEVIDKILSTGYKDELYVISPFRTVAKHCTETFENKKQVVCGTIHTFQGKEADIVLLVLGTLPGNHRGRAWASSIPNMLNVAVTRARKRLLVIGNREIWKDCNYYSHMAKVLPAIRHDDRRLKRPPNLFS